MTHDHMHIQSLDEEGLEASTENSELRSEKGVWNGQVDTEGTSRISDDMLRSASGWDKHEDHNKEASHVVAGPCGQDA